MPAGEPDGTKRIHIKRTAATGCAEIDDRSADVTAYRYTEDPGEIGSESLPEDLCGEITRLRHALQEIIGKLYWHQTPASNLEKLAAMLAATEEWDSSTEALSYTLTYTDLPGMSRTKTFKAAKLLIIFNAYVGMSNTELAGVYFDFRLLVDTSVEAYGTLRTEVAGITSEGMVTMARLVTVTAGSHTVKVQYRVSNANGGYISGKSLIIVELPS